jgi:hypothetical protein
MLEELKKSLQENQKILELGQNSLPQGFKTITETGNSAISQISKVAEKAKEATSQAIDTAIGTVEKTKDSFNETWQSSEKLSNSAANVLQKEIATSFENWLEAHPVLAWLGAHPLLALIIFVLLWLLLGGLFRALQSLSERAWLIVLGFPIKLFQWSLRKVPQTLSSSVNLALTESELNAKDKEKRLLSILSQLQEIKKEQEKLWEEMTTILALKS